MTITNTLSRARGLASLIVIAVTSLTFSSCAKDDSPSSASALAQQTDAIAPIYTETIELPLEASMSLDGDTEGELRALNAKVDNQLNARNQHGITLPAQLPVTIVIRSDRDAAWAHYVTDLKAVRNANGTYKLDAADRIKIKNAPALAANKTWYYMVIAGGTYNNSTKKISVDASAQETVSGATLTRDGGRSGMDFVMATRWIPIPRHANGHPKWRQEGWTTAQANSQKVNLYPLGVLCRATLRLDENYKSVVATGAATTLSVNRLRVVSTALSFKGEFDLSVSKLPTNLTATTGKPQLSWTNTQPSLSATMKEYPYTDSNVNEYEKVFQAASGSNTPVLSVSGNRSARIFSSDALPNTASKKTLPDGIQALVFWAMPVTGVAVGNLHTTLIADYGLSNNAKVLAPGRTYIYGKKHGRVATSGSTIYLDGVYYNPYTPLEYMAQWNMSRKNPGSFVDKGAIPTGVTNQWVGNNGVNAYAAVRLAEAKTVSMTDAGRAYTLPTVEQFESVVPFRDSRARVILIRNTTVSENDIPVRVQLGTGVGNSMVSVRKKQGEETMYSLALAGYGGNNKHRVAYQYNMVSNSEAPVTTPRLTETLGATRFAGSNTYGTGRRMMNITATHIGEYFLGTIDDLATSAYFQKGYRSMYYRTLVPSYTYIRTYYSAAGAYVNGGEEITFYGFSNVSNYLAGVSSHSDRLRWAMYGTPQAISGVSGAQPVPQAGVDRLRLTVRPFTTTERP